MKELREKMIRVMDIHCCFINYPAPSSHILNFSCSQLGLCIYGYMLKSHNKEENDVT